MELRVLRYFMTIAREGSITSAANVLHVTQPTLSRQIRDLENEPEVIHPWKSSYDLNRGRYGFAEACGRNPLYGR